MGRKRKSKFPPELIKMLIQSYDIQGMGDIKSMIRDLVGDTIQGMLDGELINELGYEKNDADNKDTDNSRNGYSRKTLRSECGEVYINVPRTVMENLSHKSLRRIKLILVELKTR